MVREREVSLSVMPVASTVVEMTVTLQEADTFPQEAVRIAVPAEIALTVPQLSTVATDGFEDVQVTVLSVALSGVTVA